MPRRRRPGTAAAAWAWPCFLLLLLHLHLAASANAADADADADALLTLKSSLDGSDRLPWRPDTAPSLCAAWPGVRQCAPTGRVTKLVLEGLNLTGTLTAALLAPLAELRVLSLRSNSLTGPIPEALPRVLPNLKLLYLADNRFQGRVPPALALLHRATVIVLSGNRLTGQIPPSLASLPRLTALLLDRNLLTGAVPPLPQTTLRALNVSGNRLAGRIPAALANRFNASSFLPNAGLCGAPLDVPCDSGGVGDGPSPAPLTAATAAFAPLPPPRTRTRRRNNAAAVVAGATVAGVVVLAVLVAAAALLESRRGRNKRVAGDGDVDKGGGGGGDANTAAAAAEAAEEEQAHHHHHHASSTAAAAAGPATTAAVGGREFSWEREGIGKLVFCGGAAGAAEMYSLEELLRASAETLGRGEVGSTYKAVMETGFIVTVKRMRDPSAGGVGAADFGRRAEELGRVRHPNAVPLRAYFQAKEERLLVYDYFPNGSLFSLVHGSRPSSKGKPLHWTSCMKIAEDVAAGLLHLHQSSIVHGNLKPSNVLLGPDFESCLTDYGLVPTLLPSNAELHSSSSSSSSLFYRAPEVRGAYAHAASFTAATDVYSFGVLLLELLTGRTPFQDLMELHGDDIPSWVRAVREEERETESGGESVSAGGAEEKLTALIGIAATCVAADPGRRPTTAELLRMVREARAEAMSSSNSSDRSPARWSDAMLGVPREQAAESFTDRDRD